jgi:hypothetical protein
MAVFAAFMPMAAPAQDGVLLMAHGGDETWNQKVENAAELVRQHYPVEIAFGMADTASLAAAAEKLEARGVRRVAVVRLFISGASFLERTEYILGQRKNLDPTQHGRSTTSGHSMPPLPIASTMEFRLSKEGLLNCAEIGQILKSRVAALSKEPSKETVLILAHGTGDDAENGLWLAAMRKQASVVKQLGRFRAIHCRTVREDWPEKREKAVAEIRGLVEQAQADGGRCLVIPYRLAGFGGYAEVLNGLSYEAEKTGFLPHPLIDEWILRTARDLLTDSAEAPSAPRSGDVAPRRG